LKFGSENQLDVHLLPYKSFLWFSTDRTTWKKSRYYQFSWMCAAHLHRRIQDFFRGGSRTSSYGCVL